MSNLAELKSELELVDSHIWPLAKRKREIESQIDTERSRLWIEANGVKKDDIELSSGDNKPWVGSIPKFVEWMKKQPKTKRFAEWNGRVYFTSDLIENRMPFEMSGILEDIPN